MGPLCLYHRIDLDGVCSAAIVRAKFPDAECWGINYGDRVPWDKMPQGRPVIIVDFTAYDQNAPAGSRMGWMKAIAARGPVIWVDHHATALKDADDEGFTCPGLRRIGDAGCELAWEFFFGEQPMPLVVRLLGRHDVWDHTDPDTWPLQYALRAHDPRPTDDRWATWLASEVEVDRLISEGRLVHKYAMQQEARTSKAGWFETMLDGHKIVACNATGNSSLMDAVWDDSKGWKFMALFAMSWKGWKVSLFSHGTGSEVNLGEIAQKYGGGGHQGAAGFQIPPGQKLPFWTPMEGPAK